MNRMLNFVREKAFALILLGSIAAAVGTGIWAMRTVQQNLNQTTLPDENEAFDGFDTADLEGDGIWNESVADVTDEMNGEIAMDDAAPAETVAPTAAQDAVVLEPGVSDGQIAPDSQPDSSMDASGASLPSEPSEASVVLEPQAITVTPSFVLPVSGAMVQAFSGDELVYNETLSDWRTHNGADYAASLGEEVIAPVTGQIVTVYTDGNWGGVVELETADGYLWRFCGVENSTLQAGDAVTIGQVLGEIGTISAESGADPHLHLEILQDGVYQDPSLFIK